MIRALLLLAVFQAAPGTAQPTKTPAELEKPLELFTGGKFDECLEELRKVVRANPTLRPARLILAEWFARAGRGPDARLNLERAITEDPKHPEVYLLNANVAFGEGRITDSLLNLQQVQQYAADVRWTAEQRKRFLLDARQGLASCYENRGDVATLRDVLQSILADDPKNGAVRQRLAGAIFAQDKPDEAFSELSKAFVDDPLVDLPELRMATLWTAKANGSAKPEEAKASRDQAENWMKKAMTAHAQSAKPFRAYANWLMDDGRAEAAVPYVDAATKLEPNARETLSVLGILARYKKDFTAAEAAFEKLYKDGPNDPFAVGNLAIVLAESANADKQKRAINLGTALVQQNPRSLDAVALLGWARFKAARFDEAEEAFNSVLKAGGQMSPDSVYFISKMLAERKKYDDANKLLTAVLAARGPFVYRPEAIALQTEVAKFVTTPKK